jgi:hypothetical protein
MSVLQPEVAALVTRQRLAELDQLRERLPLTDPDRHDLDTVDVTCRSLAPTSTWKDAQQ